ncbi:hypothetical protein O0I10_011436 [Lichtheimia ornata]|uniref:Heterokaryon incompatibility domain-containing protein n=1 Tax=Lichtheimia ornata TaxID=688661 RepID=A0AAD7UT12_9FUNG|nr:uncharacterized protein O0I10_011436 [Lichtheimia ornata]KAJ8652902.1 hypothetical protein O0I10_011436 [Lichtheimia ornata]
MTYDTEEDNDPYKINIRLEDDEDSKRKRFFEKGLSTLLDDEYFLLLYVPANGGKMKVIRPANDAYHRKRIIKRINEERRIPSFYYALSHLWGLTENNRYHWNDISEYVDDEQGQSMQPVSMRDEKRDALLTMLKDHPDSYWWIDVLCARTDTPLDIMGDIYACCLECIIMIDCQPSLIPKIHTLYQQLHQTPGYERIEVLDTLATFLQSQWWQRVWTWQEMALPVGDVRFTAETDIHGLQSNTITLEKLLEFNTLMGDTLMGDGLTVTSYHLQHKLLHDYGKELLFLEVAQRFRDIDSARKSNVVRRATTESVHGVMMPLMYSNRRCYDPCDYVYGVLGMMQIKIPRMDDPNSVWRHFLSELDNLSPLKFGTWSHRADDIDLRKVDNLGDVYGKLSMIYIRDVNGLYY